MDKENDTISDEIKAQSTKRTELTRTNKVMRGRDKSNLNIPEENVFLIAMANATMTSTGNAVSRLYPSDCKLYKGIDKNNLSRAFRRLEAASKAGSLNKTYVIYDEQEDKKHIIGVIDDITQDLKTGALEFKFTQGFSKHFNTIMKNESFTKLSIETLTQFNRQSSRKMFEILSTYEYKLNKYRSFTVNFDLWELKYSLSLCNEEYSYLEEKYIKKLGYVPPARELFENCPGLEKYEGRWDSFKVKVLDKAKSDFDNLIEQGANIFTFNYIPQRAGRGGKVVSIDISIYYPEKENEETEKMDNEFVEMINIGEEYISKDIYFEIKSIFKKGEPVNDFAILQLLKKSNSDVMAIRRTYNFFVTKDVPNLIAYMLDCLEHPEKYQDSIRNDPRYDSYEKVVAADERIRRYREVEQIKEERAKKNQTKEGNFPMMTVDTFYERVKHDVSTNRIYYNISNYYNGEDYIVVLSKHSGTFAEDLVCAAEIVNLIIDSIFGFTLLKGVIFRALEQLNYNLLGLIKIIDEIYVYDEIVDDKDLIGEIKQRLT